MIRYLKRGKDEQGRADDDAQVRATVEGILKEAKERIESAVEGIEVNSSNFLGTLEVEPSAWAVVRWARRILHRMVQESRPLPVVRAPVAPR